MATPADPAPPVDTAPSVDTAPAAEARSGGVLVVGGAGFVGSHLVDRLIAEGRSVDVVDDLSTGSLGNLAAARTEAARLDVGELHIHTLDACSDDLGTLIAMRRPREIFHLALVTRRDDSAVALGRSFTSMLGVLEAARRSGVTKIVVALPATSLYGQPAGRDLPVKEGALAPRGVRGVVAKAIVDLLTAYREDWGIEFTALAVSSVFGPRQRPDGGVVAALVAAAAAGAPPRLTGDGRQSRDFVYVDDVVDALVRAGQRGSGLVVNVGTGIQTSLRDLWKQIAPDGPEPVLVPARADEVLRFAVSPVRARIHLAWSPWTTLAEGLDALR
jgi:UDP-glucose 4-epimerase